MTTNQTRIKEQNSETRSSCECLQPQFSDSQKNSTPTCNLSTSSSCSHFVGPLSAFYATEHCTNFPQLEASIVDSPEENNNINIDSKDTLQSLIQSSYGSYNPKVSLDKSFAIPSNMMPKGKLFLFLKSLSAFKIATTNPRQPCVAYEGYRDLHRIEKQPPCHSNATNESNSSNRAVLISSKSRIRWTKELHEQFVECVERLGGAEKATPKEILKLMNNDTLTIFHVKSHLQKYRTSKHIAKLTTGNQEGNACANLMPLLDGKIGKKIVEALRVHMDVQNSLNEQLEIQKNLQRQIEEQGKQLQKMLENQLKANKDLNGDAKSPNQPIFQKDDDIVRTKMILPKQ